MAIDDNEYVSRYGLIDRASQFLRHVEAVSSTEIAELVQTDFAPARRENGSFDRVYLSTRFPFPQGGPLSCFGNAYIGTSEIALQVWAETGGSQLKPRLIRKQVPLLLASDGPDGTVDWLRSEAGGDRLEPAKLLDYWVDLRGGAQFLDDHFGGILNDTIRKWKR